MLNSGYGMEELDYATREASFQAKSGDEGCSGVGCGRPVSITSRRRICSGHWAGGGYADDEEHHARARHYFRRRGDIRRQLGDVLRFREGKGGSARVWHTACQRWLRRLQRLRWRQRLWRQRLWRLQGLRRGRLGLRRLRVRLLSVMGILPLVLDRSHALIIDRRGLWRLGSIHRPVC
jgi:hypothetical protein